MKITESNILKCGFKTTHQINTDIILNKMRGLMPNRKILSIVDSKSYIKEIEYELYGFDSTVDKTLNIFKCKLENGRHGWILMDFQSLCCEIKKVDDILAISSTLEYNGKLGFLYVIKSDFGYKIGYSKIIENRNQVFSVKLPFDYEYHKIYQLERYKDMEKMLHELFQRNHINGEWFNLEANDFKMIEQLYERLS